LSNNTAEERNPSVPVESHEDPEDEENDPMNPEAFSIDPKSLADAQAIQTESIHDDDADRAAFVDAAAEKANVQPAKRSSGCFAHEDDLFDL
jgi:hypothetical protein